MVFLWWSVSCLLNPTWKLNEICIFIFQLRSLCQKAILHVLFCSTIKYNYIAKESETSCFCNEIFIYCILINPYWEGFFVFWFVFFKLQIPIQFYGKRSQWKLQAFIYVDGTSFLIHLQKYLIYETKTLQQLLDMCKPQHFEANQTWLWRKCSKNISWFEKVFLTCLAHTSANWALCCPWTEISLTLFGQTLYYIEALLASVWHFYHITAWVITGADR